jgi:serine protein kinase
MPRQRRKRNFGIIGKDRELFTGSGYMKWIEEVNREQHHLHEVMSFDDYLSMIEKMPQKELRTCPVYLLDMFNHFGRNPEGGFNLFLRTHPDAPPVHGQKRTQEKIYHSLKNFIEEGYNNKFLLLVGPNGSSKSSLIKKLMLATEDYSSTDEGALYTFSWIFPIDQYVKGSLGLGSASVHDKHLKSYAHLEDKDISAILPSELKDHPLLLMPKITRQKFIQTVLKNQPKHLDMIKKTYLYQGDLSLKNRQILEALLKTTKGSYEEVYKYIRVERVFINRRYSRGATTIEPQLHVDAQLQQITMDRRLASLPPSLQSLNLFQMSGEVVLANRGILEYSDLLKRPLDTFKYLLMTMESKTINLQGILTELDIFFIGSSNEIHFSAFKQHPDFNSFKGRFTFIKVPYLLNFKDEIKIYEEQIGHIKEKSLFEPHALEALSLWSVLTRLRASSGGNFREDKIGTIAESINPLEKALYYADQTTPENMDSESRQLLKASYEEIISEFENDGMYEGKFGISPREVKQFIYDLSEKYPHVTFIEIIDELQELSDRKQEFDFLNITPQVGFHDSYRALELIQKHFLTLLDNEVRSSLGLVDDRSYEEYIARYILSINAIIKGEKLKNNVTGKFEPPDPFFVKEFESHIYVNEAPEKFRSNLIARLGAYSLDNPGKAIVYTKVFDDIVKMLQESFRKEQQKIIQKLGKNLVIYLSEKNGTPTASLSQENRQHILNVLTNMEKKYGYSERGAITLLQYLLKKSYDTGA